MKTTEIRVKLSEGLPGYNNSRGAEVTVLADCDESLDVTAIIAAKLSEIRKGLREEANATVSKVVISEEELKSLLEDPEPEVFKRGRGRPKKEEASKSKKTTLEDLLNDGDDDF